MKYTQKEIDKYIENIAALATCMVDVMCLSEEIMSMDITKERKNDIDFRDSELFMKCAKSYAKLAQERMGIDLDTAEVQEAQQLANELKDCCDEHNWFED